MSIDLENTDPDYMVNRKYSKDEFIRLLDSLVEQKSLGPVPYTRARRTIEYLFDRNDQPIVEDWEGNI